MSSENPPNQFQEPSDPRRDPVPEIKVGYLFRWKPVVAREFTLPKFYRGSPEERDLMENLETILILEEFVDSKTNKLTWKVLTKTGMILAIDETFWAGNERLGCLYERVEI